MSEPMQRNTSKARIAAALMAACLGLALNLPVEAIATERLRLVVTHTAPPLVPNSVMDLADTLGFYRREGLTVDFVRVQSTPLAIVALKTGNADLANISLSGALQLAGQRVMKVKAVLSPDKAIRYLIASHSDVPSIKALEGFTLGIGGVGSLDHSMTRLVLAAHGVDVEKVKIVALGEPHTRALALSARRIDATTMSVGTWSRFRDRPGLKVLLSDDDYFNAAPVLNKVIVAEQDVVTARRPAVERFVAALVKASRTFAADPGAWVEAMRQVRPDVPQRELEELARSFARHWSVNGGLDPAQVSYSIEQLYRQAEFRDVRRVNADELLDMAPLRSVLSRIGIMAGIDEPAQ